MIAFWSSQLAQELTNFLGGPVQTVEGLTGLSFLIMGYRHLNCHHEKCWRIRTYPHGHLKLCKLHHPLVPNDGVITQEHIDAIVA